MSVIRLLIYVMAHVKQSWFIYFILITDRDTFNSREEAIILNLSEKKSMFSATKFPAPRHSRVAVKIGRRLLKILHVKVVLLKTE